MEDGNPLPTQQELLASQKARDERELAYILTEINAKHSEGYEFIPIDLVERFVVTLARLSGDVNLTFDDAYRYLTEYVSGYGSKLDDANKEVDRLDENLSRLEEEASKASAEIDRLTGERNYLTRRNEELSDKVTELQEEINEIERRAIPQSQHTIELLGEAATVLGFIPAFRDLSDEITQHAAWLVSELANGSQESIKKPLE